MGMLRILPYNSVTFDKGIVIGDAYDVRVTYEINGERRLDFSHPINEKSEIISENKIVVCEGQAYRIIKVSKTIGEKNFIAAECSHVYNADASNIHIQNIPDLIGKTPSYVLGQIFKNTKFSIMTDSELTKVGLKRVDYSGLKLISFLWIRPIRMRRLRLLLKTAVRARFMPTITRLPLWSV